MANQGLISKKERDVWKLAIGALGVVYGDIGTSPLYAFKEAALHVAHDHTILQQEILGIVSLIIWTLAIIVTMKYVILLLNIDNKGEGGTLALMALARSITYKNTTPFLFLGMMGAALFYGDAVITPAISVLSAVEGLKVVSPSLAPLVLPVTIAIIVGLFYMQSRGTGQMSNLFGPVMSLWFLTLIALGLPHIAGHPDILKAVSPHYALLFLAHNGMASFIVLGSVFLAVTGAEALYADLGHFGKQPIRLAWGWLVFPALIVSYLGQGALLLQNPAAIENPFFLMAPAGLILPLVIFAAIATIIASQAVITGAFSLTRQAVNLRLLPRIAVLHTSARHAGQIYMPHVNYILMSMVLLLVIMFRSSGALASAYGISVTGAMLIDAIMVFFVVWHVRNWPLALTALVVLPFILIEMVFFGSNVLKIIDGGWLPLAIALAIMAIMMTWIKGSYILGSRSRKRERPLGQFLNSYRADHPGLSRVAGTAIYMTKDPERTPEALRQNIKHNKVIHEKNILMSVVVSSEPYVPAASRVLITPLNADFTQLILRYGFMEIPDVQSELMRLHKTPGNGIDFDWDDTSLFISRRTLRGHPSYGMPAWQDWLYIWMHKNSADTSDYYRLPINRVIEIGHPVVI